MPPKRKSARQAGRSAAKITKRATPSSSASSDLAEVSAAQQTAEPVNIVDLTSVVTLAVTEALKAVGVGQTTPLSSPPTVNPSPGPVDASATVETATAAEIASISSLSAGMSISNSNDKPSEVNFTSVAIDLEARVSAKLKAKIWADEYIDFGALLSSFPDDDKFILSFNNDGKSPSLCLEPSKPKPKFLSLGQWQTAFNTFVAVYTVKYPLKVAALLKYCEVVRDIANKSGNWRYYDQQFRYLRQTNPEKFPWDRVMWELWNQAIHVTSKSPSENIRNKKPQTRPFLSFPKGVCWKFHSGEFCAGCRFKHTCFKCGATHHATQCHAKPSVQRFGFSIGYLGDKFNFRSKNLKSAFENPREVTDKFNKEVLSGRIIGPFDTPPFENFRISPLGLVPKKAPGEFRLIHHLSFPEGSSVNDGIPR